MDACPRWNPQSYMTLGMSVLLLLIKNQVVFYRRWDMLMLTDIKSEPSILVKRFGLIDNNDVFHKTLLVFVHVLPGEQRLHTYPLGIFGSRTEASASHYMDAGPFQFYLHICPINNLPSGVKLP